MDVTILDTSAQLVHCEVQDKNSTFTCWMTFGYGLNTSTEKMHLWDHWRQLGRGCHNPWVVLGYFNAILSHEDKLNGDPVMPQDLTDFQQCVDDIGVGPLPSKAHRTCLSERPTKGELENSQLFDPFRLMAHAPQSEDEKRREKERKNKRVRMSRPKSHRINHLCGKCGRNHQGVYRAGSGLCFGCGKPGHSIRDFSQTGSHGQYNRPSAQSGATSRQHPNRIYTLQSRKD
ncbi:hypothetical protein FXO37_34753 [Capsicum annuum]|nr:hypothetical protein FXO37_34753 [Capsicum annuum]